MLLTDGELIIVEKVVERNRVNENGGRELWGRGDGSKGTWDR